MAAKQSRRDEVLSVIAQEATVDPASIDTTATVADLGISSLDLIELIFKIESHFSIEVPTEGPLEGTEVTVDALIDHVVALIDESGGPDTKAAS